MQRVDSFCGSERQSRLSVRSAASAAAGCPGEAWPLLLRNQHPPRKRLSDFSCCHSSTLCVATDPLTGNAERSLTVQARLARSFPTLSSAAPIHPPPSTMTTLANQPYVTLNDGNKIPQFGLGVCASLGLAQRIAPS